MIVVISPRGFNNYGQDEIEFMKKHNINVHYNGTGIPYTNNEFRALCEDADGIIVGVDTIDRDFIDSCMNLKVICKFGVGTDNIDVEYAKSKNIIKV